MSEYIDHPYNDFASHICDYIPDLLTEEECAKARILFDKYSPVETEGKVGDDYGRIVQVDHVLRRCMVTDIPHNEETAWLHEKLESQMLKSNERFWQFEITDFREEMRQMKYGPDEHFQSLHMDQGPSYSSLRKLSIVVQIAHEDDYEGGDFAFHGFNPFDNEQGADWNAKKLGSAIVFPCYQFHNVTPVISGERRTIVHRAIGPCYR